MTLNAAAQLQNAFDRQERTRERAARNAPGGDAFGAAAQQDGSAPGPAQPAERKPAPVLDRSARRALVEQAAGKSSRQVMRLLAEVDPELAAPADRVRPLGAGRWELKAVIDDECRRGLDRLKGLLSHVDPHMTLGQIVGRLVQEGLDRHDPARPPRGRRTGVHAAGGGAGRRSRCAAAGGPRPGPPGSFGREAGDRHHFGGEDAVPRPAGCGVREVGSAADPNFDSEGGRPDRPRHPGGGQARGLAARPGPLQLRGPHQRAPLRLPTPAADRSRRAVCPRRPRRAEQSSTAVRRSSPPPPRRRRIWPPRRGSSGAGSVLRRISSATGLRASEITHHQSGTNPRIEAAVSACGSLSCALHAASPAPDRFR